MRNYKSSPAASLTLLLLAICAFTFTGCSQSLTGAATEKAISEPEVLDLLNKIEAAAKKKDANAVISNISENGQIRATVTASGQTQTLTLSRGQYRSMVQQSFEIGSNYVYNRQNTQVKISADGKTAIATDEVTESMTVNGRAISTVASEVATIGRENGNLVIQYLEVVGKQN